MSVKAADPDLAGPRCLAIHPAQSFACNLKLISRQRTALHISAAYGSVKLAALLLTAGASLDAMDEA